MSASLNAEYIEADLLLTLEVMRLISRSLSSIFSTAAFISCAAAGMSFFFIRSRTGRRSISPNCFGWTNPRSNHAVMRPIPNIIIFVLLLERGLEAVADLNFPR